MASPVPAVEFERVSLAFDELVVLRDVSFTVLPGHLLVLIGASGAGKSVVLKMMLGLLKPDSGVIRIDGRRVDDMTEDEWRAVRAGIGMLFQESALFDSLTVADNVGYGMTETTSMTPDAIRQRVEEVVGVLGMGDYLDRLPSELSGGQRRRVAVARAMAARPPLLLLDEPTSGLDPITARTVDDEIVRLRDVEGATTLLVTHQLRDALYIASHQAQRTGGRVVVREADCTEAARSRFIMLRDAGIYFEGTAAALRASTDPYLRAFLG